MRFDVETGGRRRTIEIEAAPGGWSAAVDGRRVSASLVRAGSRWSLLLDSGEGRIRASYEIALDARGGETLVHVDGRAVPVSLLDPRARRRPREATGHAAAALEVAAPMPGRVVKVLVRPGDAVTARQGVVVVEAMKMENELRAPRAGIVSEVRVREGESVEARTVLVVVEPGPVPGDGT